LTVETEMFLKTIKHTEKKYNMLKQLQNMPTDLVQGNLNFVYNYLIS